MLIFINASSQIGLFSTTFLSPNQLKENKKKVSERGFGRKEVRKKIWNTFLVDLISKCQILLRAQLTANLTDRPTARLADHLLSAHSLYSFIPLNRLPSVLHRFINRTSNRCRFDSNPTWRSSVCKAECSAAIHTCFLALADWLNQTNPRVHNLLSRCLSERMSSDAAH